MDAAQWAITNHDGQGILAAGCRQRLVLPAGYQQRLVPPAGCAISTPTGRSGTGTWVCTRIAQRLLVLATAIRHNWKINAPVERSLIAYDH